MVNDAIERVRAHLQKPGITKTGLALAAGLSPNALRDADHPDWNPSANTLKALEPHIIPDEPAQQAAA
jgi:3,4-dihydroxy 2-butanone 4-phosphate synthase/GTP cyclohydrolase II